MQYYSVLTPHSCSTDVAADKCKRFINQRQHPVDRSSVFYCNPDLSNSRLSPPHGADALHFSVLRLNRFKNHFALWDLKSGLELCIHVQRTQL